MATTIIFDTLAYANKLKGVGVPEKQAEVQAEALAEVIEDRLATKDDIEKLEERLENKIEEMGYKMIIRTGGIVALAVTALAAIVKL